MENSVSTLVLDLWLRKIYNSKDKSVKLKMDPLTSSLPSYFVSFFFFLYRNTSFWKSFCSFDLFSLLQ